MPAMLSKDVLDERDAEGRQRRYYSQLVEWLDYRLCPHERVGRGIIVKMDNGINKPLRFFNNSEVT